VSKEHVTVPSLFVHSLGSCARAAPAGNITTAAMIAATRPVARPSHRPEGPPSDRQSPTRRAITILTTTTTLDPLRQPITQPPPFGPTLHR
jgi:hypothetical protein